MSAPAVETTGLSRRFGDFYAVRDVALQVPAGSFYGFLGPNGAGKSTTIKCLTGLLIPTAGTIRILGLDPAAGEMEIKRSTGVVPEDQALFDRLTGGETLRFVGRIHGIPRRQLDERTGELFDLLDLENAAGKLVADYSHGMRKKLALAVALLPAPRLLFLDEPFEGIDAVASKLIKDILHRFVQRGGTVFLTSHVIEIVERLATHLGIIHQGRLIAQGTVEEIRQSSPEGTSLEDIFISLVGGDAADAPRLDWLV